MMGSSPMRGSGRVAVPGAASTVDRALGLCRQAAGAPLVLAEQEHRFAALDALIAGDSGLPDRLLADSRFRALHERLLVARAAYEYARERALAEAILGAGDTSPVDAFRSADMYRKTHAFESRALGGRDFRRVLFVGCGPFPITAVAWQQTFPDAVVTCLERLEEGCRLARGVARVYGCEGLEFHHGDALDLKDFSAFDYVHVGTVVGVSMAEKRQVIEHFLARVPAKTLLAFRTAVGPGRVVYPEIDAASLNGTRHRLLADPPQRTYSLILTDRTDRSA